MCWLGRDQTQNFCILPYLKAHTHTHTIYWEALMIYCVYFLILSSHFYAFLTCLTSLNDIYVLLELPCNQHLASQYLAPCKINKVLFKTKYYSPPPFPRKIWKVFCFITKCIILKLAIFDHRENPSLLVDNQWWGKGK